MPLFAVAEVLDSNRRSPFEFKLPEEENVKGKVIYVFQAVSGPGSAAVLVRSRICVGRKENMKTISIILLILSLLMNHSVFCKAQNVEDKVGIQIVHNKSGGKWGAKPELALKLIGTLGSPDVEDDNFAFHNPYDIAFDSSDNIYILDMGNDRIQKFSPEGRYLGTIGRQGQGPGEFQSPFSLDIDSKGYLYVAEGGSRRIQILTSEGKAYRTIRNTRYLVIKLRHLQSGLIATAGYPGIRFTEPKLQKLVKLIKVIDLKGNLGLELVDMFDFKSNKANVFGNLIDFDIGKDGCYYVSFKHQNRVEKYSPDGKFLWRADRPLNYGTEPISLGTITQEPQLNQVSSAIAVDARGRAWVSTLSRQLTREEEGAVITAPGVRKVESASELENIDAFKLEIFDPDGILLGEMRLDHRVHGMRIHKQHLFIWERNFDKYYQYEIIEK